MYNPYDLIEVTIAGQVVHGRPYQFDSSPVGDSVYNGFGNYVKPTHLSTTCPLCGQGIMIEDLKLPDPPFPIVEWVCDTCTPGAPPPVDMFMNPLEAGRISDNDLDPLLYNPEDHVVHNDDDATVASRLEAMGSVGELEGYVPPEESVEKIPEEATESPEKPLVEDPAPVVQETVEAKEDPKEAFSFASKEPQTMEKAEGISEEVDFDDDDMVEDE